MAYKRVMKCPHCQSEINVGSLLGSIKSERKAMASRLNGSKRKGWVRGLPPAKCSLGWCLNASTVKYVTSDGIKFYCDLHNPKAE